MTTEPADRLIAAKLRQRQSLPSLAPEQAWHPGLDAEIAALSVSKLAGDRPDGLDAARCWVAALHLWNDSLDRAHELVQEVHTPTGSALHGILHRREGDYDNAKYWFRRAGDHPAYHGLQSRVSDWIGERARTQGLPAGPVGDAVRTMAGQGAWNPYLFADAAALAVRRIGDDEARATLESIQHLELAAFIRYLEPLIR